jgi:O-antigen biosynthesis protein
MKGAESMEGDLGSDGRVPGPEWFARYRWAAEVVSGRVLDAACGTGHGTALLARVADVAVGVDFAPPALERARREHGAVAEFREGDLRDLPFDDAVFDHALCFEAIAHVREPETVVDELRRVLRPGGLLLISAPNRGVYPPGNPLHLSEISSLELQALLDARFANVAIYRQQTYFASLLGAASLLGQADLDAELDVGVAKLTGGPLGSELHAVAAATDGELPSAPASLSIGEEVDYADQRRMLEEWQRRAIEAESEVLALRRTLGDLHE